MDKIEEVLKTMEITCHWNKDVKCKLTDNCEKCKHKPAEKNLPYYNAEAKHIEWEDSYENAQGIIEAVSEGAMLVLEPENAEQRTKIEKEIIEVQEQALALHKRKSAGEINELTYNAEIAICSERMINLEQQQKTLNTVATRYSEIRNWLDTFAEHTRNGDITDAGDAMVMKTLVEKIIVKDEGIEVVCKCGVTIEQKYVK